MGLLNGAEIEQTKLLANALDRASTACFTVGIATPLAGYAYQITAFSAMPGSVMALNLLTWFLNAALLHYIARRALRRLG